VSDKTETKCCCSSPEPDVVAEPQVACCADTNQPEVVPLDGERWIVGKVATPRGDVPVVATELASADHIGAWKARWGFGRMKYSIRPGLYAVGKPTPESPVFVSANYKMSFDRLRAALPGVDGWLLVLDTRGINVWCAAGKGTFGRDELMRQIDATQLGTILNHNKLVVPQLGAPGIAAHEVRKQSDFRIIYGPVRSEDIPAFLETGMKATPEMRRVEFPLWDRLAVAPVELVMSAKYVLAIMVALLLLAGLGAGGYSWAQVFGTGVWSAALFGFSFVAGTILTPALLPWLPGRAFSAKGVWIGLAVLPLAGGLMWITPSASTNWLDVAAWCLLVPTTTSFAAMNFTGSTTYTSLSGVRREMKIAVPVQAGAALIGTILWLAGRFI
jgi:acetyl-CoA decarbonylase/synthase complex subunit gamma